MQDRYEVRDADQIRAMIHPLRKQILEQLNLGASTPSDVARALGVSASKIHYHVRILEKAGLVSLVDTKQVGSVKELYFEPIARAIIIRPNTDDEGSLDLAYKNANKDLAQFMQDIRTADLAGERSQHRMPSLFSQLIITADEGGQKLVDETVTLLLHQFARAQKEDAGSEYRLIVGLVKKKKDSL